jgi:hypothetical protein
MGDLGTTFYTWASTQPVFIQVAIGLAMVLVGLYVLGSMLGYTVLFFLRRSEKKRAKSARGGQGNRERDQNSCFES